MIYSKLKSVGSYLPKKMLTNKDLEKIVDTSDEWIVTRTGIHSRHIAESHETPSSMAEEAAKKALAKAGLEPEEIDLIIVTTATPEKFFPSTACLLQQRLDIGGCMAFDLSAACAGFVYALSVADQFIRNGTTKRALLVGSEIMSRIINWEDRNTCVLFGDGAGAVVLEASPEPGILDTKLYADGRQKDLLDLKTNLYVESHDIKSNISMQGRELFKFAVENMVHSVQEILEKNEISVSDVDWFIPHQANTRIVDLLAARVGFPKERVIKTISEHANTSSASIPLAFDQAICENKIKRGQTILLEAIGGGLTWGSVVLKY